MARQISVSNEVYKELSSLKGNESFSEVIKEAIGIKKNNQKFMKFAGMLKKDKKKLAELQRIVANEREANRGRVFDR